MRRWIGRILLGLVALVLLGAGAVAGAIWWSLPSHDLQAQLPGLAAPVAITLDADGVPFISAQSEADAAAALGFMHARDRMFQMELMRRAASGRLSELVGPATLRLDRTMRTLGLRRRAETEAASLDPATKSLLEAYARGVNAWIARRGRFAAPEFIVLGAPEPWTTVDSLLWGKTMALYLAGDWRLKLERAKLAPRLSPEVTRALWPAWAATPHPDAALVGTTRLASIIPDFPAPFTLPSSASNEWAVDGKHSATGAPLLAGDPHLALTFPGIWYLARIETPDHTLAGATAPGVPFLVIGHNSRIAWTFTTTGADTQDIFIETPLENGTYATQEGPKPFTTREERIHVRGGPDDVITVRETRHGPVLSDLDPRPGGPVLAVSMAALEAPDTAAAGLLALNRAATLDQAGVAAAAISAPVQNLLVADRERIGLFTTGRVPIRKAGDGALPVAGADGANDWTGYAAGPELPRFVAPASGRLVNANERTAPPDFPVFMGSTAFGDWRARRIRTMLDGREQHDAAEFAAMQVDAVSAFAQQILPALLATKPADGAGRQALDRLRSWNASMAADRSEPLLFNAWVRRFFADVMETLGLQDEPVGPIIDVVGQALSPGGQALCGGDCALLLTRSLAETTQSLGGTSPSWGAVHHTAFAHPLLGRLPVIGGLFNWQIPQPGDDSTVFRGTPSAPGWDSVHGPGYRGVYDLADLDRSLFAIAPGQSGNPFSADAASTMRRWRDGVPILLGKRPSVASGKIELTP
jgi:penicillin amidase